MNSRKTKIGAETKKVNVVVLERRAVPVAHEVVDQPGGALGVGADLSRDCSPAVETRAANSTSASEAWP